MKMARNSKFLEGNWEEWSIIWEDSFLKIHLQVDGNPSAKKSINKSENTVLLSVCGVQPLESTKQTLLL